jgi:hypothetical protein
MRCLRMMEKSRRIGSNWNSFEIGQAENVILATHTGARRTGKIRAPGAVGCESGSARQTARVFVVWIHATDICSSCGRP